MNFFEECARAIECMPSEEYKKFSDKYDASHDIILLGNGGSNSAASHIAQDMTKRGGKRAMSFTDPSMLTCFINDYGMDFAYSRFLESYATPSTFVILISSSGNSRNLVNAVRFCESEKIDYGILTAFDEHNNMRSAAKNAVFKYHIHTDS